MLCVEFVFEEGELVMLFENVLIVDGNVVDILLDKVENVVVGKLVISVDIIMQGVDNQLGFKFNFIKSEILLMIILVNMFFVGLVQVVLMMEKEVMIDVLVVGLGKVWLVEQSFGVDEVMLLKGVDVLKVILQYDFVDNVFELVKGEEVMLFVIFFVENMEDGVLVFKLMLSLQFVEDNQEVQLFLQFKGLMIMFLSKSVFGLVFVLVVFLGFLILLVVFYFMKWFLGCIFEFLCMFVKMILVKKDGMSFICMDIGKLFVVFKDEFQGVVFVDVVLCWVNLGLYEVKVKMGFSLFIVVYVEIEKDGFIFGKGKQFGGCVILLLVVQNNWFFVGNVNDKDCGEIVLIIDMMVYVEKYDEFFEEINCFVLVFFEQVQFLVLKELKVLKGLKGE